MTQTLLDTRTHRLRRNSEAESDLAALAKLPSKTMIAQLSSLQISRMPCIELVRAIRAAGLPALVQPGIDVHLEFYDRETLEQLAYLARRCCRNQGY